MLTYKLRISTSILLIHLEYYGFCYYRKNMYFTAKIIFIQNCKNTVKTVINMNHNVILHYFYLLNKTSNYMQFL